MKILTLKHLRDNQKIFQRCLHSSVDHEWLKGVSLSGKIFEDCDLRSLDELGVKNLTNVRFDQCNLNMVCFASETDFSGTSFLGCNLQDADFEECDLGGAAFVECVMAETSFSGAKGFYVLPVGDERGYFPYAVFTQRNEWQVRSGCRRLTIREARKHWGRGYNSTVREISRWALSDQSRKRAIAQSRLDRNRGNRYLRALDWLEKMTKPKAKRKSRRKL